MLWNYRVVKEEIDNLGGKFEKYRIIQVYYDNNGLITGWVDCSDSILTVTDNIDGQAYENLKGNVQRVVLAFDKPYLILKGDELIDSID